MTPVPVAERRASGLAVRGWSEGTAGIVLKGPRLHIPMPLYSYDFSAFALSARHTMIHTALVSELREC